MNDTASKSSRPRRAWWQWVVGGGLLVAAGYFALARWMPGLLSHPATIEPREIRVAAEFEPRDVVPVASGELAGSNVLMVTFDTTRADRIGCYGHDGARTFTLDQLAREGVLFSQAIAPAPSTLPSHASMMTGLYPYHHRARANGLFRLDNDYQTLAEVLAADGYATGAMVSAAVLEAPYGLDQGFGDYDDEMTSEKQEPLVAERSAAETGPLAEDWILKHAADKFFLWVHFYDPHWPYQAPASDEMNPYDAEIAFADAQLGRLIGLIDDLGLTDKTLVVVAGDHGEGLGQHDEWTHSTLVYESTLHVPLIMRCGKRLGGGAHVSRLVSLVDVMPTVLSMLGIDAPAGLDGVDLTRPEEGSPVVFSETLQGLVDHGWAALLGVRDGTTKYIYGPRDELYDLSQDPFEEKNLIASRAETAAGMKRQLTAFFGNDLEQAAFAEPTHELDPAALAKLQSLGYLGGGVNARTAADRPHPSDMMPIQQRVFVALGLEVTEGLAESTKALEKIVDDYPDLYTGHLSLARAYRKAGDLERAETEFARSLELDPERWEPLTALAAMRVRQNQMAEAIELYRAASAGHPENFVVLKELGRLLIQTGEFDEGT
ncbi:MAG: sulfatase-like hydrolase/transferase, partial [Gemmatimonadetes bacterium]|nr:sulfatase-like hydrolase/transferase [Gemmatimonadota bacterium]